LQLNLEKQGQFYTPAGIKNLSQVISVEKTNETVYTAYDQPGSGSTFINYQMKLQMGLPLRPRKEILQQKLAIMNMWLHGASEASNYFIETCSRLV
jgi:hypothetical protein